MAKTTISSKYQVVIPKETREAAGLKTGQELQVFVRNGIITMVPIQPNGSLFGFIKGMSTDDLREKKDRL